MNNDTTNNITLVGFIWKHVRKYRVGFFSVVFLFGLLSFERVYLPYLVGKMIDIMSALQHRDMWWQTMQQPVILIVLLVLATDFIVRLRELINEYITPRFKASIQKEAFEYIMHHSNRFFAENQLGVTSNKIIILVRAIDNILTKIIVDFIPTLLTVIMSAIAIINMSTEIGLVYSIWMTAHITIAIFATSLTRKFFDIWVKTLNTVQGKIVDSMNNILSIRMFLVQKQEIKYYQKYQNEEINASYKAGLVAIYIKIILGIVGIFSLVGIIYFVMQEWSLNKISLGQASTIFGIVITSMNLIWNTSAKMCLFYRHVTGASESLELLNMKHEIDYMKKSKGLTIANKTSSIEFRNVSFNHEKDKPFFQNLNVTIKSGEKIGLVGFSGSGKTTFVNLIMREFDIQNGQILINDQDIKTVNLYSLRQNIAYITQDISMFNRTIMENIRFGNETASDEEIFEISQDAFCHEFIIELDKGYNTVLGDNGTKVSGGQKQRISIARAMLKKSPIIIFDEATSALDSITEKKIKDAINRLSKDRTTLIIAHRLSTLREVNKILVFNNGVIIESGNHDELMKKENGHYKKLWESQNEYC